MLLFLCVLPLRAQNDRIELRRVEADSLLWFLKNRIDPDLYYILDTTDMTKYTVIADRGGFLDAAVAELGKNGYTFSQFGDSKFILRNLGLQTSLPTGYFAKETTEQDQDAFSRYLENENTVVTFQNKVYDIGDPTTVRTGKATVRGYVRDVATGEPLVGVSVFQVDGGAFTQTDAYGFYRILLPVGENVLGFSGYSLEDMNLHLVVFDDGGLDVVMKEKVFALKGAVISAESMTAHKTNRMGVDLVRIGTIKHVPAVFGESDVIKVVLTLPGVKSTGEASSGFNVRGGATDQNLILFNDCTVYNPNHMFGIFSAFNTDVISDIELYKSSIPAQYGGRISSVLEVRGREGNAKKVTGSLGIGMLTSHFHLEGPLKKERTTFILGGRTTYSNWILNLLPEDSNFAGGAAQFYDGNIGISHKFNDDNSIHLNGYYSSDTFRFSNDTSFHYRNMNGSVKFRSNLDERNSMEVVLGYDNYGYGVSDTYNPFEAYSMSVGIQQAFLKLRFKSLLTEKHTFSYGASAIGYDLQPGMRTALGNGSGVMNKYLEHEKAIEAAAHLSDTWQITHRFSIEAGVRVSPYFTQSAFYCYPEFRLSGKYMFLDNFSFKAGVNTMRQFIHMISNTNVVSPTDTWKLSNDRIRPQDGWQAASGLYLTVYDNTIDISAEGYYKEMYNYIDYKSGAVLVMNDNLEDDLITTMGRAYGVELMAKKSLGKLNGWLSYSYSRTMLREMEDRGVNTINGGDWYNAPHDKPHEVKMVANYKFTHRYSLSCNLEYSTGRPVTLPVSSYLYAGGERLFYTARNSYRIPDYFRLDLAMNIEPGHYLKKLTHMSLTFGVYNVTGRKNAYSIYYDTSSGRLSGHMLSVFATQIPYVNLNLKF